MSCGHEFTAEELAAGSAADGAGEDKYAGFVVGRIAAAEPIKAKGKKDLKEVKVRISLGKDGKEDEEDEEEDAGVVSVVTNAKYTEVGKYVVVALPGAIVPAGSGEDGEVVKVASVGGRKSHGMLCDCPMLGWVGGAAGVAVVLDDASVGERPPEERPGAKK